ncbi:hypothetical protein ACFY36_02630 [Actinoplanes sp. NPDC000266]
MSPVSRRRKKAKPRRSGQRVLRAVPEAGQECDCPDCSGAELDPQAFAGDLTAAAAPLLAVDDPLEAELLGASFVGLVETLSEEIVPR